MYIKNKKTGLIQECHNEDVIRVCKKDPENFEVVDIPKKKEPQAEPGKDAVPGGVSGKTLEDMTIVELKALAKGKGIEGSASLNKEDLLAVLKDVI